MSKWPYSGVYKLEIIKFLTIVHDAICFPDKLAIIRYILRLFDDNTERFTEMCQTSTPREYSRSQVSV
jgi:hypothetical protein